MAGFQVSTSTDKQWALIAGLCGHPELGTDRRFESTAARMRNIDDVDRVVAGWTSTQPVAQVLAAFMAAGIPAAHIARLDELLSEPQFQAREMVRSLVADGHAVVTSGSIFTLSKTPACISQAAPRLGEHTEAVLAEPSRRIATAAGSAASAEGARPLDGLVVVELGAYGAGPFCARLLAELGAEVIKVEPPGGDPIRHFQPAIHGVSYPYHFYNLNKRDVTIDLKTDEGRSQLQDLLRRADVFLENLAPGTVEGWGFGYDDVAPRFPKLIYCSVSGFGRTGPSAARRAYDTTIQALSGVMSLTGRADRGPTKVGLSIADFMGPTSACAAILGALQWRNRTGEGQFVDVSMYDVMGWSTQAFWPTYLTTGIVPEMTGDSHTALSPHGTFAASDGRVALAVEKPEQWQALARLLRAEDSAFAALGTDERIARRQAIEAEVAAWVAGGTVAERVALCQSKGIPASAVCEVAAVAASPQTASRHLLLDVADPEGRSVPVIQSAFRMSRTPGGVTAPGPRLGAHNAQYFGTKTP